MRGDPHHEVQVTVGGALAAAAALACQADALPIGHAGRGSEGAPNGDLYFVVQIAPHPRYRVDGRDLYVDLPLAPWEAALGTSVAVETPGGEMKVKVPPGTSSGKRLRLRERGLPHPRGRHGHLYAEVKIMVPAKLTDEERRLFEQLAATSAFDPRSR